MVEHVFIITGVNQGFGLTLLIAAIENGFVAEGVSKSSRSSKIPPSANFTQLDCADHEQVVRYWEKINTKYGTSSRIILINNAGTYIKKSFEDLTAADIRISIQDNFFTAVNMMKGLSTFYESGSVLNIISIAGLRGASRTKLINKSAYSAAKAALSTFFLALQDEYAGSGYRIMNFYPGAINTWSIVDEPNTIEPNELANWIIATALLDGSFHLSECVVVPFTI